jgi:hypothetical protein
MPTDKQAKLAMQGAMEFESKKWQLVVVALETKIAQLEEEVRQLKEWK